MNIQSDKSKQQQLKNNQQNEQHPVKKKQQQNPKGQKISLFTIASLIRKLGFPKQKSQNCKHARGCIQSVLQQSIQIFINGYFIKSGMSLALGIKKIINKPSKIGSMLVSKDSLNFGLFLGSFVLIYKGLRCFLRRHLAEDKHKFIPLIAGLFAGSLSFFFLEQKSRKTYAVFLLIRAIDATYQIMVKKGILPEFKYFYVLVFGVMMAITGYAFAVEPATMAPEVYRFYLSYLNETLSDQQMRQIWIQRKNNELAKYSIPRQNPLDYMPVLRKYHNSKK